MSLSSWFTRLFRRSTRKSARKASATAHLSRWKRTILHLERLEDRLAPAANIWQGAAGGLWNVVGNWSLGHTPIASDTLTFNATDTNSSVDNIAGLSVAGLSMTAYTGTIDLSGNSLTVVDFNGDASGTVTSSSGTPTLTVNNAAADTFGGTLSGSLALTVGGTSTFTLTGSNSYTGGTDINAGILNIQSATALGAATADTTVADGAALQIQIAGTNTITQAEFIFLGTTFPSGATGSLDESPSGNGVNIQTNTLAGTVVVPLPTASETQLTISVDVGLPPPDQLILSGPITGAGGAGTGVGIIKAGAGTLVLSSSSNSYAGATTVSGGLLQDGVANALPTTTALVINGGTFDLNGFAQTVGSLSDGGVTTGTLTNSSGTAATFTDKDSGSNTFGGVISGNLNFTMNGTGAVTLSGSNTYTGGTNIDQGTIIVDSATGLGTGTATVGDGTTNGTLELNAPSGSTIANNVNLDGASGTGSVLDFAGTNLTLSGILSFTQGSQAETVEVDGSSNTATLSGHLSDENGGARPFTKTGLGTVIITQDNGYTSNGMNAAISFGSDTHINAGQIELTNGNGLGDGTFAHTITVASGAALELSGSITLPSGLTLDLTGSGINGTGALHTIGSSGFASTVAGLISLASPSAVIGVDSAGTTTLSGKVTGLGELIVGAATTGLTTGTLILTNNTDDYSGGTLVNDGILNIQAANALGSTTADTTVADGATLQIAIAGSNTITQAHFNFLGTTFAAGATGSLEESPSGGGVNIQNNTLAGAIVLPAATGVETQFTMSVDVGAPPPDTLTLDGTVNGAITLVLAGAGDLIFAGVVGGSTPLTGIIQNAGTGTSSFNADVTVGAGGANFQSNVALGGTGITFTSGGPVTFGTGSSNTLTVEGTGPTTITTTNQDVTLNAATQVTQAKDLSFNLGSGTFTQNAGATIDMTNGGGNPAGANLTVTADQMTLGAAINAGTGGFVDLAPGTLSQAITVGTAPGTSLGFTQTELDEITTGSGLVIGQDSSAPTTTGNIQVTAAITSTGTGWTALALITGGTITQTAGSTITATGLDAIGEGGVTLTESGNTVTDLDGLTKSTAGSAFDFVNSTSLTVAQAGGLSTVGITTDGGAVDLTALGANSLLTVSNAIDTTNAGGTPAGADITLSADQMTLSAAVDGGTGGIVQLTPVTSGRVINLGTVVAGDLNLSDASLGEVTAKVLRIGAPGQATASNIQISGAITAHAGYSTLSFITADAVTQTASLAVTNLAVLANGPITLNDAGNVVTNIVLDDNGDITFTDNHALTTSATVLDPSEGAVGVQSGFGNVTLTTLTGDLTLMGNVKAAITAYLTAAGAIVDPAGATVDPNNVALSATTGIGTMAAPVLTTATNLVAQNTTSGGIFISNTGALTIGFTGDPFTGVHVNAGSGAIAFTNAGTLNITTAGEIVETDAATGGGGITITTTSGDIITGGNNNAVIVNSTDSSAAMLDAAGNITIGTGGTFGSVIGGGPVTLMAGGNIVIDEDSTVESGGGGGAVNVTAGGNVFIVATTVAGAKLQVETGSSALTVTTGAGDTFTDNSGTGGGVFTQGGALTINADAMLLLDPVNATASGVVTLTPVTAGRAISLGAKTAGDLGLTDTELGQVTAKQLTIGGTANTGGIELTANISSHAGYGILELQTGGAITDPGGFTLDPPDLALDAATGIGTSAAPMITAVNDLVARTTTSGGIFISNTGDLTIGFAGDPFTGVRASGAVGQMIQLTNAGTLDVTNTNTSGGLGEDIVATGDVTVTTTGTTSDILTGTHQSILSTDTGSIVSSGGTAKVTAGRDLLLGDTATDSIGNVEGGGSVVLSAGRHISIDVGTFVNAHGTGTVTAAAGTAGNGGNVSLFQNAADPGAEISTAGGAITLTTGAGSTFIANSGQAAGDVQSNGGNITIIADLVTLTDAPSLVAGSGIVDISTVTPTEIINLGTKTAGELGLTDTELSHVNTSSLLRIGSNATVPGGTVPANTGGIVVSAAGIGSTTPANYNSTLSLVTGGSITTTAGAGTLTITNLALQAASAFLTSPSNSIGHLAANVTGATSFAFFLDDSTSLNVDSTIDGVTGIAVPNSTGTAITVNGFGSSATALTTAQAITSGSGDIRIAYDNFTLGASLSAGTHRVTLDNATGSRPFTLGTKPGTSVGLLQSDLNEVTAGVLQIGATGGDTGGITITGPIAAPATWNTLDLENDGLITNNSVAANKITVANLAVRSGGGINLDTAGVLNNPSPTEPTLNLALDNTSGAVAIRNTGGVVIMSLDGLATSSNTGTTTTFTAASPFTYAVNFTSAGDINTTTMETADETGNPPEDNINVNPGVTVESTGGNVNFTAADSIITGAGSLIKSDTGAITLSIGVGDTDNDATLQLNGSLSFATALNISEPGTISLDSLAPFLDQPGKTISITSTGGAIVDAIPADGDDDTDVIANDLSLSAADGIGALSSPAALIVTEVNNLVARNSTSGGIFITNIGNLNVGFTGEPFAGVTDSAAGGAVQLSTNAGSSFSIGAGQSVATSNGPISLTADDMNLGGAVNAGTGTVTILPVTTTETIDLGTTAFPAPAGTLGLSAAEIAEITGGTVIIGSTADTGNINISASVGTANYNILELLTGAAITDPAASVVTATDLALSAATGIGTVGAPVGTASSGLVAQTTTSGGIFITNTGALTVGFTGDPFHGVDVLAGTGGIALTSNGSITITTSGETVRTDAGTNAGPITIDSTGASILTGGNQGAVVVNGATASVVTLEAAGNVTLGTGGTNGDVVGGGPISVTAGGNITLDNGTIVASIGAGNVTATAGGNITIQKTSKTGASFTTQGGVITLTTGAGKTFTAEGGNAAGALQSNGGNITVNADDMVIDDPIVAGAGIVTLDQAGTTLQNIFVGLGGAALGLSDAELAEVTGSVLRIGRPDNFGTIDIDGAVTTHAGFDVLDLITGGSVREDTGGSITVTNLAVQAAGGATLNSNSNNVTNLSGVSTPANVGNAFNFSTGNPDGKMATASRPSSTGNPEIESADDFLLTSPTELTSATFTGLVPTGSIVSGAGSVVEQVVVEIYLVFPQNSTNPPNGAVPTRTNSPSDVELEDRDSMVGNLTFTTTVLNANFAAANSVVTGIHPIPNQTTGGDGAVNGEDVQFNVTFTTPLLLPANHYFFVPQVLLSNGNFLWLSAPKPITAPGTPFSPDLQEWIRDAALEPNWLRVGTDIVGGAPAPTFNATFSLTGTVTAAPFQFLNSTNLTVGPTVDGITGVTASGDVSVSSDQELDIDADVTSTGASNNVVLQAGPVLTINPAATVKAGGTITLNGDFNNTAATDITLAGASLKATSATINGNSHNDTFNLDLHTTTPITVHGGGSQTLPIQTLSFSVGTANLGQAYGVGDTLNLDDSTDTAAETTFITTGYVQLVGGAAVSLNGVGTLNLSTGTGDDTVSVFGTPANLTTINAGGDLTLQVSGTADFSSLVVNAANGDSINAGINSTGLGSLLQLNGGSGGNTYVVFGTGQAAGLQLNGGSGNDVMYLLASGLGSFLALNGGGAGTDSFVVTGNTGSVDANLGTMVIDGTGGTADQLVMNDSGSTGTHSYSVTSTAVTQDGMGPLAYSGIGVLSVLMGQGTNTMRVYSQASGTTTALYGEGGSDNVFVTVDADSAYNNLAFMGGNGFEELHVLDNAGNSVFTPGTAPGTAAKRSGSVSVLPPGGMLSIVEYAAVDEIVYS